MDFKYFGKTENAKLLLIPGLGVSYEIFLPLISRLEKDFCIIVVQLDGFILNKYSHFTSIHEQANQIINHINHTCEGHIQCAYGLSLGGKILSNILEKNQIVIEHCILDAAPLLPLPKWLVYPFSYLQGINVKMCYHWSSLFKLFFSSHYFETLFNECLKIYPFGGAQAIIKGYQSIYTNKLLSIPDTDIHYWYGTKEAFFAKAQIKHLLTLHKDTHIEAFKQLNHGQLLIDCPEKIVYLIKKICSLTLFDESSI